MFEAAFLFTQAGTLVRTIKPHLIIRAARLDINGMAPSALLKVAYRIPGASNF